MTCELEMIHSVDEAEVYTEDQIDDFFAEQLALHQSLIIRGWCRKCRLSIRTSHEATSNVES